MRNVLFLIVALILSAGCSSSFVINDADKIPEGERVKFLVHRNIVLYKVDGKKTPIAARGPGSPEMLTYFLTPGAHTLDVQYMAMEEDKGVAIVIKPGKGTELKTDTREDPVQLKHSFAGGKTYKLMFTFPDDYSIKYSIDEQ